MAGVDVNISQTPSSETRVVRMHQNPDGSLVPIVKVAEGSIEATIENATITVDLSAAEDSVTAHGDVGALKQNAQGELKVEVTNPGTSDGLTDAELRAAPVAVSGPLTDTELRAAAVPVSGPLTDAELRAAAVPVTSDALTDAELRASAVPVSGPLTDTELRAAAVPVSAAALPLPAGAATDSKLDEVVAAIEAQPAGGDASNAKLDELKTKLGDGTQKTQVTSAAGAAAIVDSPNSNNITQENNALAVHAAVYGRTTDGAAGETGGGSFQGLFQKIRDLLVQIRDNAQNVAVSLITGVTNRTTTYTNTQTNPNHLAATVALEVTDIGTGELKLKIQEKVTSGGTPVYRTLVETLGITANGTYTVRVGPGIKEVANESAAYRLPREWRIEVEAVNANPTTWNLYRSLTK